MAESQPAGDDGATRREQGMEIRSRILGDQWNDASRTTPGLAMFTELGIEHIWSASWTDPTLEMRLKSLTTISALVALRHSGLLRFHVLGALRERLLTAAELRAVALHLNPYVGYPTAREAMVVIDAAIAEHEGTAGGSGSA